MISIFLLADLLISQNLFAKTYGRSGEERAYTVIPTSDGGYAVAGYAWVSISQEFDCLLFKISSTGELLWSKSIGGNRCDYAFALNQTSDGGYAMAGWEESYSLPYTGFFVLKFTSDGDLQWAKTFDGQYHDFAWSVIQCSDGGYAVAGQTESFGAGYFDALILKLSPSGDLQWAKTFGGTMSDYLYSVIQTTDGGLMAVGGTISFGSGGVDALVLKLSSDGSLLWAKAFGGTSEEVARSVIQTSDGGYAVAGWTRSSGAGGYDILVLKLASDGTPLWTRTFGGTGDERAFSIVQTYDGGYALAGHTSSFGYGSYDFLVLKLASDGTLLWTSSFGSTGEDHLTSILQAPDYGYIMAGTLGLENFDPAIIRIGSDGLYPGCVQTYSLVQGTPSLAVTSPSGIAICSPSSSSPDPLVSSLAL
ncbi:MAG: hypothetical protein ABIM46_02790, partial [candidate division WOR-3 bacterium]